MPTAEFGHVRWQSAEVTSPVLEQAVPVVVARDVPYLKGGHRFQNLNIYLPATPETTELIGTPVESLPQGSGSELPLYHVHVHGGAWRDPQLTARSVEPTVAHAFRVTDDNTPITAVASLDYTLSPFPGHPTLPYDGAGTDPRDPSREVVHPAHVSDVLRFIDVLRSFGLTDESYGISWHSA